MKPLKILVVDDSRSSRMMIKSCIRDSGIPVEEIEEADNGEVALTKAQASSFDLILMDIHMPKMDGYQATERIRIWHQRNHKPRVPIIALTAMDQKQAVEKTRAAGFTMYLGKPLKQAAFAQAIHLATSCGPVDEIQQPVETPKESGGLFRRLLGAGNAPADLEQASLRDQRSTFIAEKRREVSEAIKALDQGDISTVNLLAYRLKGEGANFGFSKVSEFGTELANAVATIDLGGARRVVQLLGQYLEKQAV